RQRILTDREKEIFENAFSHLENGEPPQYITGTAYFYGLELKVNPAVLIPRPETERLVELTLGRLKGTERILDIGTGSGAIAIALKHTLPSLNVSATEISPSALETAEMNAKRYQAEIHFYLSDCFPSIKQSYDVLISNPPYISKAEFVTLDGRVKDKEPIIALAGGEDGLDFYRKLLSQSSDYLSENGFLALEHSDTQREAIINIGKKEGWTKIESLKDLSDKDRYLFFKR
ncbi:MAG TPA: peptide chain release factor N(5)-glutamine methyltransferase, partial [Candidatus Cloacimonas sp.]|nr:peptide chain release factor N(5)-glutamine methyltransferase [Candidatus Cloacimonas sp.]